MTTPQWWREAVCYQIYPRSFADSNRDGIGDIQGIIDKLDYLAWLGVTVLWISPFYPSAQLDWGYDISDYTDVHPDYGNLADVDRLIAEAHKRGIRILLDLVLNHTSDQHQWFMQARSSRDNPYRDWYVWRDAKAESPPNDWESIFGGSAWEWDPLTEQYYYHFFFKEQPDLNWRNPQVRQAIYDVMRFWLNRGVDGFRLDAIGSLFEDEHLTNSSVEGTLEAMFIGARSGVFEDWELMGRKMRYQMNLPEIHRVLAAMRSLVNEYGDRVLLGESADESLCGNGHDQLHSVFNFGLTDTPLNAARLYAQLAERHARFPDAAQDCNTLSNHDRRRSYSVYADGKHDAQRARLALALVTFLSGTPVYYYGEEIGMTNLEFTDLDQLRDEFGIRFYHILRERYGIDHEEAFNTAARFMGRDGSRTPMQWSGQPGAGFTSEHIDSWLPIHSNHMLGVNVEAQRADARSMLTFFRDIVRLRQQNPALTKGSIALLPPHGDVLAFWRKAAEQQCLIALNISEDPGMLPIGAASLYSLYNTGVYPANAQNGTLYLEPYQLYVGEQKGEDS
ncbi:MAG: alpha-glucosidase [Chloroflexota bacterium]|nr:alpha-glucosidase [Chloroflexota bacterium]